MAAAVVAIHQPNFLPWLGYFDKLARADVFVLLDSVQFPKKAGTWMNRTRIVVAGETAWLTVPVVRAHHGVRAVSEMLIDDSRPWRRKAIRTIEQSYAKAPYMAEVMPLFEEIVGMEADHLADFNESGVRKIAAAVGLDDSKLVRASSLAPQGRATDLLIELTRKAGGSVYLAGGGAGGYQEDEKFAAAQVELRPQGFKPPVYPQLSDEFQPGASIVDALMNIGPDGTRALLT